MNKRFAGEDLAVALGLVGVPTAVAAHAVSHDDMDYLAQDFKNFNRDFEAMSPNAQQAYLVITAENKLSGLDRALVGAALRGEMEPPKRLKQREIWQWRKRLLSGKKHRKLLRK